MSEFHNDDFRRSRNVTIEPDAPNNRKAGVAFFLSLLFFIPLAPLVAVFLAVSVLKKTENGTRRGGAKLAGCALHIGLLLTIGQFFFGFRGYEFVHQVSNGPGEALNAGFAGNLTDFRGAFETALPTSDSEAQLFLDELKARYGQFRVNTLVPDTSGNGSITAPHSYELMFENATVTADAAVAVDSELSTSWLTSRLQYIKIRDPKNGDLVFPSPKPRQMAAQPITD